jgi:hypothetical protein
MSLRPEVSGFDLLKMTTFIGCGDLAVVERAQAHARAMFSGASVEIAEPLLERLRQAILGELKPGVVEVEDSALIHAMIALSYLDQKHQETNSNRWKSVHIDWAVELPDRLEGAEEAAWKDALTLVEYAVLQRPLFGSHQESDWATYGYLRRNEVQRLIDYRRRFPRLGKDEYGFAPAFFDWLTGIAASGLDYWFYAQ